MAEVLENFGVFHHPYLTYECLKKALLARASLILADQVTGQNNCFADLNIKIA